MGLNGPLAVIVPSLGEAPEIERILDALRTEVAALEGRLIWVHQGTRAPPRLGGECERLVALPAPVGFARAVHAGLAAAPEAEWVALVNDDLEPEPGWLALLADALAADPGLAAAQGVHLVAADPGAADGCGLAWNRWWQAVQLGHGEPAPPRDTPPFEIFGVSATGALYRRSALAATALAGGWILDERLDSWYEDVELAIRLRAAGWRSLCVPAARARHAGSATGGRRPFARARRVAGNRWLVVARLLGRRLPAALPRLAARDLADVAHALARGEVAVAAGYPAGWATALARAASFVRSGPPLVGGETLARFRVGSRG